MWQADQRSLNAHLSKAFAFELDKIEHLKKPVGDVVAVLRSNLFHRKVGGHVCDASASVIIA